MVKRKVTIAVDEIFFRDIFEKKRKARQNQLGVINLSQANFTKMIKEIKLKPLKSEMPILKINRRRKKDAFSI